LTKLIQNTKIVEFNTCSASKTLPQDDYNTELCLIDLVAAYLWFQTASTHLVVSPREVWRCLLTEIGKLPEMPATLCPRTLFVGCCYSCSERRFAFHWFFSPTFRLALSHSCRLW